MKTETIVGIYAVSMIFLILCGLSLLMYPFSYYENIDASDIRDILMIVITKFGGIGMLYVGTRIYEKHFRKKP